MYVVDLSVRLIVEERQPGRVRLCTTGVPFIDALLFCGVRHLWLPNSYS